MNKAVSIHNYPSEISTKTNSENYSVIEQVVMQGDLSKLDAHQRVMYYNRICESTGLNPFTRPFDYIMLNGKLTLYAKKDCTEQLRKLNGISIESLDDKVLGDLYIVKARARDKTGRTDESTGAVTIGHLKGEARANAIMKAETKAKRRVTLSISGLGFVDETEIETIPGHRRVDVDINTGEMDKKIEVKEFTEIVDVERITKNQAQDLANILDECEESYKEKIYSKVARIYKTEDLSGLPTDMYEVTKKHAIKNMEKNHEMQRRQFEQSQLIVSDEDSE